MDEVVAAVGNTPILRSDLELARLVRLIERAADETESDYGSRLLEVRIRLELQFRDLESTGTLYRLDLDVEGSRSALIARADDPDSLERALAAHGLTLGDLDELAVRVAAVDAYVEQRLRPRVRVTSEDVKAAYQELTAATAQQPGAEPPPLEAVRDRLLRLLVERSLNEEIERWVESAAEQVEVTRFHRR